jgi:transposase
METKDILAMSQRERQRFHLLQLVIKGALSLVQAAAVMKISYRHAKRLAARFRQRGAAGLIHGNRGRPAANRLPTALREKILSLSVQRYGLFNDTHFAEQLAATEQIPVSRETVRQLRRAAGIAAKRPRRGKRHFKRRVRKAQEGVMLLWDGSPHHWFGQERAACCLMAAIDDATGKLLSAFFLPTECSWGYLCLLQRIVTHYGLPGSIYQDQHSCLRRNDSHWSLEEELAGQQDPTQVGAVLAELGIQPLFALTPQAKGRVERLFGVLQDRLVAELALHGICSIPPANGFLQSYFIADYNRRFARQAAETTSAWRKAPAPSQLQPIISFRYPAVVANDNCLRLHAEIIDIPPGPAARSYAQARVEARQLLDGSYQVFHQGRLIAKTEPKPIREPIHTKARRKYTTRTQVVDKTVYLASLPN